jgi:hypothetical protein
MKKYFLISALLMFSVVACKKSDTTKPPAVATCADNSLDGLWTRTANGPNGSPACLGEKIAYKNNQGLVQSEPSSCLFIVNSIKWRNFSATNCTIQNSYTAMAVNTFEFRTGTVKFINANMVVIHGETIRNNI